MNNVKNALRAEMLACLAALEGLYGIGVHRVLVESDSLSLIKALKSGDSDLSEIRVLIREARSRCFMSFECLHFQHCRRMCNSVAHVLARYGYGLVEAPVVWGEFVPEFVSVLVASDIAGSSV